MYSFIFVLFVFIENVCVRSCVWGGKVYGGGRTQFVRSLEFFVFVFIANVCVCVCVCVSKYSLSAGIGSFVP